jgi:3-hydroxyisobutyrate dehydrogenase-like beta-hydroxyacid dehydrogenase
VKKIAMLGVGAMGLRMAHNFLKAGHSVTVYNRSPERTATLQTAGAFVAATPRIAAEGAEVVISMVRDNEASREVWLNAETGAIHSLSAGVTAVESSTISPDWVQALSKQVQATGAAFVEAPVLGTRPQAEAGQLIYLLGGTSSDLDPIREVLAATSSGQHHVGNVGAGAAMKLAINSLYGVQVAIWAEMLTLLERQGLAITQAVEVLNTLPTTSPALQVAGKLMAAKNYAPLFPIELVEKDFGYARATAQTLGSATPILAAVHAVYAQAVAQGYGNDNIVGIKQVFEG